MAFQSFVFERIWWRLFQERVMHTKLAWVSDWCLMPKWVIFQLYHDENNIITVDESDDVRFVLDQDARVRFL